MPRADVTVTITDAVVRVRAREATLSTVVRITPELPRPQSQPTLYIITIYFTNKNRNGRALRSARLPHPSRHKAKPRADVTVTTTDAGVRVRAREATPSTVGRSTPEQPRPQFSC